MKYLILTATIVCILFVQSCAQTVSHFAVYKLRDESGRETEITDLNNKAFYDLQNAKLDELKALMTDSFRTTINNSTSMQTLRLLPQEIAGKKLKTFDEYMVKSTLPSSHIIFKITNSGEPFSLDFTAREKEAYVYMAEVADSSNSYLLTLLYARTDGKWKIDGMNLKPYATNGKNALDFYKEAKVLSTQGDWLDALFVMGHWNDCKHPTDILEYDYEEQAKKLYEQLQEIASKKFPLPYTFTSINTKPKVFNASQLFFEKNELLVISYLSNISLTDTVSLKEENNKVHEATTNMFHGIIDNNWAILYRVYNVPPTVNSTPLFYKFIFKREDTRK